MDAIKQQLLRIQEQLGGLSATQKMLTATLAAVMVMTVLWYGRYAAAPEMAPLLDQPMGMEDLSRIKGYLAGNHIAYRLEGDRIFVPADRQLEALIDLGGHNLLPKDTSRGFDEIITKMTPWDGQARTRAVLEHGKEQFLSQILASFPNVATADVVINSVEERRIGGGLKPSASVRVRTKDGRADRATAQAVADFVANAVSGLEPEKITVVMNGLTQRLRTASGGMSGDDFLESRQKAEELFAGKIEQQLFFIPGIRATVTVKLNDETSTTHSKTFDDVRQSEAQTESVTEATKNPPLAAAEPGVVPNTGVAIPPVASAEAGGTEREESRTTYENFPSVTEKTSQQYAGAPTAVAAAVRVPRSYFVSVWRDQNDKKPEEKPTPAEIDPLIEAQVGKIRAEVAACTGIANAAAIAVEPYPDLLLAQMQPPVVPVAAASSIVQFVGGYGKQLVLGALAVASLVMASMIARRGADGAATVTVAGGSLDLSDDADPADREPDYPQLGSADGTMYAREMDPEALQEQQIVEQVAALVKENPEAAANLIRRWVAH